MTVGSHADADESYFRVVDVCKAHCKDTPDLIQWVEESRKGSKVHPSIAGPGLGVL